jgi:pimeloyl-ACP methyl ester carboxylesterase
MPAPARRRAFALLVACTLLLTACASDDGPEGDAAAPDSSAVTTAASDPATGAASDATTPPAPSPTNAPWTSLSGPLQRCGPQPAALHRPRFAPLTLRDPALGTIPAVRLGSGRTVVVLLHQTDGNGLCGWLPFMPAVAEAGFAALAVDLCSYGESACRAVDRGTFTDADQTGPVALAVDHARTVMHADRVVVVGASMGGSVALMSAATLPGIDAAVDLSGPVEWGGMEVVGRGRALDVPVLVAMATSEGPDEAAGAREIVANAPEGSTLLTPEAGHGYVLLNDGEGAVLPLADEVLRWVRRHAA